MLRTSLLPTLALALALGGCSAESGTEPAPPTSASSDAASATPDAPGPLTVYCGRSLKLVQPAFDAFTAETGIELEIRDGKSAQLAATLMEEQDQSPADIFFAQDAGALGAVSAAGLFDKLPAELIAAIPAKFRSNSGDWVGVSGRARVVAYSTERVKPEDLPQSIEGFTDPKWKGRIGWPPKNGSFQAFVTALRVTKGEQAAKDWLLGIQANEPKEYPKNTPCLEALNAGEIDVAFVNHYYLFRKKKEHGDGFPVANYTFPTADVGNLVNVAGVGVLKTSERREAAERFVAFLLSPAGQSVFVQGNNEYPLLPGVDGPVGMPAIGSVGHPDVDLNSLEDLQTTLELLRNVKVLR